MEFQQINHHQHQAINNENGLPRAKQQGIPGAGTAGSKSNIPVRRNVLSNVTNTKLGQAASLLGNNKFKKPVPTRPEPIQVDIKKDEVKELEKIQPVAVKRSASTTEEESIVTKSQKIQIEWQDLDEEDFNDPLMVSEYVVEIFEYLAKLEIKTLPSHDYLMKQPYLTSNMRDQLVDWMCEVHLKFRLLPETLFVSINLLDRFLSREVVQVNRLQLLGTGCLFISSKYEEIYSPTVGNFSNESGSSTEDILAAEKFILQVLEFDLSYPNPMNFLRRISKADDYDIQTRTIGKYLLEISIMESKFIGIKPSLCAAGAMKLARKMLGKEEWDGNLIHYSGDYFANEIDPIMELYIEYLVKPVIHEEFFKKYASKRFIKASIACRQWAKDFVKNGGML